ncbi:MAG TPA: peptidylprolyl isomerase [Thermodesulfovibrionales bacterium]|nr:peptidylprolyl isomerase [Thermodesulfovibrionales bacterium]
MQADRSYAITLDRVLATIGDELITYGEYHKFADGMTDVEKKDAIDEKILRVLIEDKLMLSEARRLGVDVGENEVDGAIAELRSQQGLSPEGLKEMLAAEGFNESGFRTIMKDKLRVSKLIGLEVDSKIFVTDGEKNDYYMAHILDYISKPESIELKAVFLRLEDNASVTEVTDLKRKAMKIVSLLRHGDNFEQIVEEYSDEPLKSQEGRMGTFKRGMLVPPLNSVAFSLQEGQTSDPIWVKEGAYILYVAAKNGDGYKSFDTVKEDITKKIYGQKRETMMNDWIKMLWERSRVKVNLS